VARLRTKPAFVASFLLFLYIIYIARSSSTITVLAGFRARFQLTTRTYNATMSAGISAVRIPPEGKHTASIIWLHGLGDTGNGWSFLPSAYDFNHINWIFPNAPTIPITLNMGHRMPGWFDIHSLHNVHGAEDEDGLLKSVNLVHRLITEEVDAGIPSERIIVGGFSQGCAVAILAGYTCERKLAGVAALSGWLPLLSKFVAMRTDINAKTPLFQAHGMRDGVVRFEYGKKSSDALKKLGMDVEFHQYETMAHEANPKEIKQLGEWIKDRLGAGEEVVNGESEAATAMGPAGPAVDDVD